MRRRTVQDVMTTEVVSVVPDTSYRRILDLLTDHQISAVPVLGDLGEVLGVVSEADLLHRVEFGGDAEDATLFAKLSRRSARKKADGDYAEQLMSSPPVVATPGMSLVVAARLMDLEKVKRLPVVDDDGVLVGIVSRRDLLRLQLRPDDQIRQEIVDDLIEDTLWIDPLAVQVDVASGIVTLTGIVDRRTTAQILVRMVETVPGVAEVEDKLSWEFDDTALAGSTSRRMHPFSAE